MVIDGICSVTLALLQWSLYFLHIKKQTKHLAVFWWYLQMAGDGKTIVRSTIWVWGGGRYFQPPAKGGSPVRFMRFDCDLKDCFD